MMKHEDQAQPARAPHSPPQRSRRSNGIMTPTSPSSPPAHTRTSKDAFSFDFQPLGARDSTQTTSSRAEAESPGPQGLRGSTSAMPTTKDIPFRHQVHPKHLSNSPPPSEHGIVNEDAPPGPPPHLRMPSFSATTVDGEVDDALDEPGEDQYEPLHYHHEPFKPASPKKPTPEKEDRIKSTYSDSQGSSSGQSGPRSNGGLRPDHAVRAGMPRPNSAYTLGSDLHVRGRNASPLLTPSPSDSPVSWRRSPSSGRSSEHRPASYVDLLNAPYAQQLAITQDFTQAGLKGIVGNNAALVDTKKTLEMYRMNVKKTPDPSVQYEFAVFLIQAAKEVLEKGSVADLKSEDLTREARQILQRLSDRSYPFAQYLLADGYASGFFNKGKEDYDRAFPLFVAASKHGHAESGYRAALCYEQGWGAGRNYAKAVQFYRASASKNHPGAATRLGRACLTGDMGLGKHQREGLKWLKRAAESADQQYRDAPYELGLLHETGFGADVFKDEAYAAQLFTQAAELGHPLACLKMGEAYEHGRLSCPRDPALSVHFYTGAATAGLPDAMMNLCAWYLCGAPPVLDKDEAEAYEWARTAANCGLPKAEYAVGYFTEMGIGCRRDPLEANVWYVKAAEEGDERAKQRLAIIRAAAAGDMNGAAVPTADVLGLKGDGKGAGKKGKDGENCVVM